MLALRPCCENCKKALPPESEEARICTFECTFCADCVETILNKNHSLIDRLSKLEKVHYLLLLIYSAF